MGQTPQVPPRWRPTSAREDSRSGPSGQSATDVLAGPGRNGQDAGRRGSGPPTGVTGAITGTDVVIGCSFGSGPLAFTLAGAHEATAQP